MKQERETPNEKEAQILSVSMLFMCMLPHKSEPNLNF